MKECKECGGEGCVRIDGTEASGLCGHCNGTGSANEEERVAFSGTVNSLVRDELCLLRKIADEAKKAWDSGKLTVEETHLKNLLTDRIHLESVKSENP